MELRLPAPSLLVLIGPSSSGKSTWAAATFNPGEVVSSDALRLMVGAGEDDQAAGTAAFDLLDRVVAERMRRGLTTVVDTLGLEPANRARWLAMAHGAGIPAYAVIFETSLEVCERRNAGRPHPLPKAAIRRQAARVATVSDEVAAEGFDGVIPRGEVAVVAPAIAAATRERAAGPARAGGHTFGISVSRFNWAGGRDQLATTLGSIAGRAEAAGFRDLWLMDHFRQIPAVGREWEDIPESYTTLGFLAGVTNTIRLGALVTGITYRNPALLGKMIATLDVVSGGRANAGLGIGWHQAEHEGYGWEFPPVADRYAVLEDTLEMLPLLWGKGSPPYRGRVFSAEELTCYPRPIQAKIPVLVGGSGEKRTLALVAAHADACNLFGSPEVVAGKVSALRSHCSAIGRDPSEIEVTHLMTLMPGSDRPSLAARVEAVRSRSRTAEEFVARANAGVADDLIPLIEAYRAAGADHTIVTIPDVSAPGSVEACADVIAHFAGP